jgi:hypothetical protein
MNDRPSEARQPADQPQADWFIRAVGEFRPGKAEIVKALLPTLPKSLQPEFLLLIEKLDDLGSDAISADMKIILINALNHTHDIRALRGDVRQLCEEIKALDVQLKLLIENHDGATKRTTESAAKFYEAVSDENGPILSSMKKLDHNVCTKALVTNALRGDIENLGARLYLMEQRSQRLPWMIAAILVVSMIIIGCVH